MKGIILSLVFIIFLFFLIVIVFNLWNNRKHALVLLLLFLFSIPLYVYLFMISPDNLFFLPRYSTEENHFVTMVFGIFIYLALFGGGILQLYNLTDRGFSLRILIDILESKNGNLTQEEIMKNYGGGKGIDWMYQKRIDGMLDNNFVVVNDDIVRITPKGKKTAVVFSFLRKFLNL